MFFKPKSAKEDFDANLLPQTRKQVFFDVLKLHFGKLFICSLILFAFTLPLHLTSIIKDFSSLSIQQSNLSGAITNEETYSSLQFLQGITSVINVVGFLILAIGLAGVARIIKRFAWEENVYIGNDFLKGIKQNVGQYLVLALFTGIIVLACTHITSPISVGNGLTYYLGIGGTVLCAVILMPIAGFMAVTIPVYSNRFTKNIRFALILYSKNFFKTLLACIICFIPFVLQFIPNIYCHLIGRVLSSLLIPFIMLGWFLFAFNCLDKTINKDNFPELMNKGLYVPVNNDADKGGDYLTEKNN